MQRTTHQLALSAGIFLLSCRAPEEQILSKFFDAVRSGDHVTLSGMSVVGFSGPVESWELVEVLSELRQPFRLSELRRYAAEAEEERERQFYEYSEFRKKNLEELKVIRHRLEQDPQYRFQGSWGEIQTEWESFRTRYEDLDRRRQDILLEIDRELSLAKMSLMSSEEIDRLDGEVVVKEVLLKVNRREYGERPYLFRLRMYELTSTESDYKPPSRWIITSIEEQEAS